MPSERRANEAAAIMRSAGKISEADLARRLLDEFGRCLLRYHPTVARDIIAAPRIANSTGRRVGAASDCLRGNVQNNLSIAFQGEVLRGAVFKAFYARDNKATAPALAAAPKWSLDFLGVSDISEADQSVHVALRDIGSCIIDAEPAAARALLLTEAGAPGETRAFQQITPRIAGCVPEGVTVQLSRAILVGILAEVARRRALPA